MISSKQSLKSLLAKVGWPIVRMIGRNPDDSRISVLMYHSIGSKVNAAINKEKFESHLNHVLEYCDNPVTINQLSCLDKTINRPVVSITFDDGFEDNFRIAFPILKKLNVRATFFVCTGYISREIDIAQNFINYRGLIPMDWGMLREMVSEGMEIGAHTHTHPLLSSLPLTIQENEIKKAKEVIEDKLAISVASVAIPFGNRGSYTSDTLQIMAKYYTACCTTHFSTNSYAPKVVDGMIVLDRVEPKQDFTDVEFDLALRGRMDFLRLIQRGVKR